MFLVNSIKHIPNDRHKIIELEEKAYKITRRFDMVNETSLRKGEILLLHNEWVTSENTLLLRE